MEEQIYRLHPEIPQVPEQLYTTQINEVKSIPNLFFPQFPLDSPMRKYSVHNAPKEMYEWARDYFHLDNLTVRYQIVRPGMRIHKDVNRAWCYNYLITSGNGETVWYEDDKTTIKESAVIPEKTWHWINTSVFHTVNNIEEDRLAITIFEDHDN
jgi:hypothetical protein